MLSIDEFEANYENALDYINSKLGNFMTDGSGWMMDSIKHVNLNIAKYTPIRGSSYIPTPQCLANKKALVNVQNEDQNCFLYSVLACIHNPKKNAERPAQYKKCLSELRYEGIEMPMATKDIDKFEKLNDLAISVYGCTEDGTKIWPRRISKRRDLEPINLLMLEQADQYHYVLIKNLNRLLCYNYKNPKEFCPYCLYGFDKRSKFQMAEHMETCFTYGGAKIEMPKKGENILEFTQYYKQQIAPYCIYADFESVMKKDSEIKTIHEISGYSLCVVSSYE